MKIIDLEFKGFASYADVANVTFADGLTGIVGTYEEDERKSVGAGKSTIVMTILYALFNKGSFKSVSEVINDSYEDIDHSHMYVKLKFIKHNNIYLIERGVINSVAYLDVYENDNPIGENKINSRNEEIIRILGWDYDMFTASIFFEQDKLSKLVDADGAKRREYIEKVLNTRDWTLFQELPNKRINKIADELLIKQKELTIISDKLSLIEKELATSLTIDQDITSKQEEKMILQLNIDTLSKSIQCKKEKSIILEHKKDLFKNHIATMVSVETSINNSTTKIEEIKQVLQQITIDTQAKDQSLAESKKLNINNNFKLQETINEQTVLQEQKNTLAKEIAILNSQCDQILILKDKYTEGKCEYCEQVISQEYASIKQIEKDELIARNQKEIAPKLVEVEQLTNRIEENKVQIIDKLTAEVSRIDKNITQLETQQDNMAQSYKEQTKQLETIQLQLECYKKELIRTKEDKELFVGDILTTLNLHVSNVDDFDVELLKHKEENMQVILEQIDSNTAQLQSLTTDLETLFVQKGKNVEMSKVKEDHCNVINTLTLEIKDLVLENKINSLVIKGFKEIPSNLLAKNILKIEKYANEYIKKFITYMEVCVEEDLTKASRPIEIYYKFKDKERSYRMLSGGQKTIANLGLRLAFSKIISEKTHAISEFIVLDEPFGYLDEYSRDLIKNVLADLTKYYKQIIIISHIDNVTVFPNIINVKMINDQSYIC